MASNEDYDRAISNGVLWEKTGVRLAGSRRKYPDTHVDAER